MLKTVEIRIFSKPIYIETVSLSIAWLPGDGGDFNGFGFPCRCSMFATFPRKTRNSKTIAI